MELMMIGRQVIVEEISGYAACDAHDGFNNGFNTGKNRAASDFGPSERNKRVLNRFLRIS